MFGGRVFQQTVGIPMSTNCVPLLADLFLYSYEADFIQGLLKKNEKKLARSFNFTFRHILVDDVLTLNNSRLGDFVDRIYPIELEIKDTTDRDRSASYLDLHLDNDSEGRLRTKLYDNFPIVNFPFIYSNIPAAPAYGVYISQLIRCSRACGSYQDFLDRGFLLLMTSNILWSPPSLGLPLWNICVTNDHGYVPLVVNTSQCFPHSRLITRFVTRLIRRVPLVEKELLTLPEHLSSPPVFSGVSVTPSLVVCVCFVDRCLSFCTFSFGHCVLCSSSKYEFWLPLWYFQNLLINTATRFWLLIELMLIINKEISWNI
jgi:hypothetical protein